MKLSYFFHLERADADSLIGTIHRFRKAHPDRTPVGFHKTCTNLFDFYDICYPGTNETKRAFQKRIKSQIWKHWSDKDVEWASRNKCMFSKVMLEGASHGAYSAIHDILIIVSRD